MAYLEPSSVVSQQTHSLDIGSDLGELESHSIGQFGRISSTVSSGITRANPN